MNKIVTLSALALASTIGYAASLESMSKDQVIQTFSDKTLTTISLSTINNKLVADSISIYFGKDGRTTAHLEKKPANDVPQTDQGTWTVTDDGQLCITWSRWFDAKPFCDYVYNANNSVIFVNAGGQLVSLALKNHIVSGNRISSTGMNNTTKNHMKSGAGNRMNTTIETPSNSESSY